MILSVDFWTEHLAITDLQSKSITFSTDKVTPPKTMLEHHFALSVLDEDEVSVPALSSVVIPVGARNAENIKETCSCS